MVILIIMLRGLGVDGFSRLDLNPSVSTLFFSDQLFTTLMLKLCRSNLTSYFSLRRVHEAELLTITVYGGLMQKIYDGGEGGL